MRLRTFVGWWCVFPGISFGQPGPDIRIKPLADDSFELVLHTSKSTDVAAGQAELRPTANALCHDKPFRFGHYTFETIGPLVGAARQVSSLVLTQTIYCGVTEPQTSPATASAASEWDASPGDQTRIREQTYAYLHAKDLGRYDDAYAMFTDSMKDATSMESFQASTQRFNVLAGAVLNREIIKITWYQNPPSAQDPGVFAAADFTSKFENIDIHCGYIAWYQESDGSFRIIREEENYVDKTTAATMKTSELEAFKSQFDCLPH